MATIIRNRTIRPSTRENDSPYRVKCENLGTEDTLRINIDHESDPSVKFVYEINGKELRGKKSIHFDATKLDAGWEITWKADIQPRRIL